MKPLAVHEKDKWYAIVTELAEKSLYDEIAYEPMTEASTKPIMRALIRGLSHIKAAGLIHRDIKPENILFVRIAEGLLPKYADWGQVLKATDVNAKTEVCGTKLFMAPEVRFGNIFGNNEDVFKREIFSLGAVFYAMLTSSAMPREYEMGPVDFKEAFSATQLENIGQQTERILQRMLTTNPEKRISVEELLQDPWIFGETIKKFPPTLSSQRVSLMPSTLQT